MSARSPAKVRALNSVLRSFKQRGAALVEYLPPLAIALMFGAGAYQKYGDVIQHQIARSADRLAQYYYEGWFWPEDDMAVAGPWNGGTAGSGNSGGNNPSSGGPSSAGSEGGSSLAGGGSNTTSSGNGNSSGSSGAGGAGSGSSSGAEGTGGNGLGNNLASGGAGGSTPLQCGGGNSGGDPLAPSGSGVASVAPTFTEVGNPIDLGTGNKFQTDADYTGSGANALQFVRYYNSVLTDRDVGAGIGWRHSYQRSIVFDVKNLTATVWRDDGSQYSFTLANEQALASAGVIDRLAHSGDHWLYSVANGDRETYDAQGRLQRIDYADGSSQYVTYASGGEMQSIVDSRGAALTLHWRQQHLHAVDLPNGRRLHYDYDSQWNLQSVTRTANRWYAGVIAELKTPQRRYHYDDSRHPHALTGLDDAAGARYASWGYDDVGRAVLSQHGDGAEKITLDYLAPHSDGIRTVAVTNALGLTALYTLEPARAGKYRLRDIDGKPMLNCAAVQNHHRYDRNGFVQAQYNADRIGNTYVRNARGLIEVEQTGLRFDAQENPYSVAGSTRIERQWDAEHPWVLSETRSTWSDTTPGHWQPVTRRAWTYDDRGRALTATLTDISEQQIPYTTRGTQRERRYQYRFNDAEHTDLAELAVTDSNGHTTTYRYAHDQLQAIENALHQTTRFTHYNEQGQPETITLPSGQILQLRYNEDGLPISLQRSNGAEKEITTATYDEVGRIIHLIRPDGSEQSYTYNVAGQLTHIQNGWGESLELKPNALHGQWETQEIYSVDGTLAQRHRRRFNALGQLSAIVGNARQQTAFTYSASGDLQAASEGDEDPANADRNHTTAAAYDTQHRLLELIDAAGYSTHYRYSASGQPEAITDANHNTTQYLRNGFGEIIEQDSPSTGSVIKRYDANGNLIENQCPDGNGIKFEYDALNRITTVDYPGEQNDIHYVYDQTDKDHGNGVQQLTKIETPQQTIDYRYDSLGRKVQETAKDKDSKGQFTQTTTLQYHYLPGNRLDAITYPDGSVVHYHFVKDRITEVTYTDGKTKDNKTIVKGIEYAPFGRPIGWTYGNGLTQTKHLDQDGRVTDIALTTKSDNTKALWSQHYEYDRYQNIEKIQRSEAFANRTQQFFYDKLDRLASEVQEGSGNKIPPKDTEEKRYVYDPLGNRQYRNPESKPTIGYDAAGNIETEQSSNKNRRYRYNAKNKPVVVYDNDQITALYRYSALGWRDEKKTYRNSELHRTRYAYASDGKLMSEQRNDDTQASVNYIWLGQIPVAQINNSRVAYLHTDHLTAPRVATNDEQKIIWKWHSDAFGNGVADEDADKDGRLTQINLRFAGQYADVESGLFYNLNRYYDPQQGRYTQSDPLGQLASMNTYSYVDANPVSWLDPLGLAKLQYVLIDAFGGDPTNSSKHTMKDGTDTRMLHFAAYVTDIAGKPGAGFIYDPNGIYKGLDYNGAVTWNETGADKWSDFSNFYISGYGGNNAFNTGDWAVAYYNDADAAKLYDALKGDGSTMCSSPSLPGSPFGNGSQPTDPFAPKPATQTDIKNYINNLPALPQGFYAMEHFSFPTTVHKLTKPIFDVADLPDENDPQFNMFPWHDSLTKPAEASDVEAIHPHKPGSTSGITLGRGFDLSKFTTDKNAILKVLKRVGIEDKLITDAAGLSVSEANSYWALHKTELQKITLTTEQQYLLSLYAFEAKETNINTVPGASSGVVKLYIDHIKGSAGPDWKNLDSKIQDILFDLNYRGDFHDLSANTTEKASTPFDDVQFAEDFRDAVQANSVGDLCRVMSDENWKNDPNNPGSLWRVPTDRFEKRRNSLRVGDVCPP